MKRKPKETKKERRMRQAQEAKEAAHGFFANSEYVESRLNPIPAPVAALIADCRNTVWHVKLGRMIDNVVARDRLTVREVDMVVRMVTDWEAKHSQGFGTRPQASLAIGQLLDQAINNVRRCVLNRGVLFTQAAVRDVGELVDAVLTTRAELIKAAQRAMLPEGQGAVDGYLRCIKALTEASEGALKDLEGRGQDMGIRLARQLWAWFKNARVFEIPVDVWGGLNRLHQQNFLDSMRNNNVPESETLSYIRDLAHNRPFPERLPFDTIFIGVKTGVTLEDGLGRLRLPDEDRAGMIGCTLLGYLIVGAAEQVYEMVHVINEDGDFILPLAQCYDGFWPTGETLAAWIVNDLVDLINEHNTVVTNHAPSLKMKHDFRKVSKNSAGVPPKPYYTVRMKREVIDASPPPGPRSECFGRVLSHRYDRRGHERCFVRRGAYPIDPKLEAKLIKHGYRFIIGKPNAEDAARLAYRDFPPKRLDEWLAIKVRWIEDTIIGDESLPYVPAVRIPSRTSTQHPPL